MKPEIIKNRWAEVRIYKCLSGRHYSTYTLAWREGKHRKRRSFSDHDEAVGHAQKIIDTLAEGLKDAAPLTNREVAYYRACERELGGLDLMEVINFYKEAKRLKPDESPMVRDVYERYYKDLQARNLSERHLYTVKSRLKPFVEGFHVRLGEVRVEDLRGMLATLGSPRTQNNAKAAISALYNWAMLHGMARENPTKLIRKIREVPKDPEIFTPEEMAAILPKCGDDIRPFVALGGFAGIRAAEIARLAWDDILWDQHTVLLKSHITKTSRRRAVPMSPNLVAWLSPYRNWTGPILTLKNPNRATRKAAKEAGVPWRPNALRHSAISYLMAKLGNAAVVAEQSGNSEPEVQSSYKAAVTPAESEKWFAIFP